MVRISKKSQQVSVVLPDKIYDFVESYCKQTDISLSSFVKESVIRRLEGLLLIPSRIKNGDGSDAKN